MIALWHRPDDFNCSICEEKPQLQRLKGCTGPSLRPMMYPPPEVAEYPGERVLINECPRHYMELDIQALVDRFIMAGKQITISEQEELPPPCLDAFAEISYQLRFLEAHTMASARGRPRLEGADG